MAPLSPKPTFRRSLGSRPRGSGFALHIPNASSLRNVARSLAILLTSAALEVDGAPLSLEVGHHVLVPNTPGQHIEIRVSGGAAIAGLNFKAQIGDGFPDVPGSSVDGPNITDARLDGALGPTIFSPNNAGQQDPGSVPQVALRTITTQEGTVPANGVLAILVIDTTGFAEGTFALKLGDTFAGPTEFLDQEANPIPAEIADGSITIGNVSPPTLSFTVTGGQLRLEWDSGRLEEADAVPGPWRPVEGNPSSGFVVSPTEPARFYRVRFP